VLQKEGEEKYEENKMNFEGAYLGNGLANSVKLKVPHPEGIRTENFVCFCSGSVELQMRENGIFFTRCKSLSRAPGFLFRTTHCVCLD